MPIRLRPSPVLLGLIAAQDRVIHQDQALAAGFTRDAARYRLRSGQWQELLPQVYLTTTGEPSRRQLLVAAQLYVGPHSAIDGADAAWFHGMRTTARDDGYVYVVAPLGVGARSRDFVVVRRTVASITIYRTDLLRYVDPAAAAIAATRRMTSERAVLATLSEALQRRISSYDDLVRAHVQAPRRNARFADAALADLGSGIRSAPESDFRKLAAASMVLPAAEYNVWLELACGRIVCVDAWIESSALVHEVNGRTSHAREDLFEDMQERHDALTASGIVALHNYPRRISTRGREVIAQVERTHEIYAGRGMPRGVKRLAIARQRSSMTA